MSITKNTVNNICHQGRKRKGTAATVLVGMEVSMEISVEVPQKLKTEHPFDLATPLLGVTVHGLWGKLRVHAYCSAVHCKQDMDPAWTPIHTEGHIRKLWATYTGRLLSHQER